MEKEPTGTNERKTSREQRAWIAAAVFALLFTGCLALLITAQSIGFGSEGNKTYIRLESAVNNYPFCPPQIPCPISRVMDRNHWTVWAIRETETVRGVEKTWQTLVSIPLW